MPKERKFLTYALEGNPTGIEGWGVPPKVGDIFDQVRVRALIPVPAQPDHLVVVFTPLPRS
jgi:hypothetical protein